MTYNGHKNWNHWNVALWIGNDEGLYSLARECLRHFAGHRRPAARAMLEGLPPKTPDGAPYSFSSVYAALDGLS
jgi:hypothetical protein